MNEYMVVVRFSSSFNAEFLSLIPRHRALVDELTQKGTITSYSLSADRSTLWMTLLASSRDAAEKTLRLMPLYHYMQYQITELMFHNTPARSVPHFSLN
jgi:muconolactone delta-isomerase